MRKSLFAVVLFFLLPIELFAWGQEGHRIIAEIAYRHLGPVARHRVDRIMGEKRGMVYWANWADEIKSDTIYPQSHSWHYQDFDEGLPDSVVIAALTDYPQVGGNLFRAADSLANRLKKDRSERDNLRFVVHLAGDRFCPMHTAHHVDHGGNMIKMKWFGQSTSLHTIWDTHLIESQGYSYMEYATMLDARYGHLRRQIEQQTDAEVLLHNYYLCSSIYDYQPTWDGNTYHYIYRFKSEMEYQLYVAGIRLAKLLNQLY